MVGELPQVRKSRLNFRQPQQRAPQIPRRRDHVEHLEQLCRLQAGSLRRPLDQIPHISCAADGDIRELGQKIDGLGGDIEQVCDRRCVAAGTQFARLLGRDAETTLLRRGDPGSPDIRAWPEHAHARMEIPGRDDCDWVQCSAGIETLGVKHSVDTNMRSPLSSAVDHARPLGASRCGAIDPRAAAAASRSRP